jgi:DNA polymerase III alpha subunit
VNSPELTRLVGSLNRRVGSLTLGKSMERRFDQIEAGAGALPKLQAAMKELEEAAMVTAYQQAKQASQGKEYAEWLEGHTRALAEHAGQSRSWMRTSPS